jgi:hypothetical protein
MYICRWDRFATTFRSFNMASNSALNSGSILNRRFISTKAFSIIVYIKNIPHDVSLVSCSFSSMISASSWFNCSGSMPNRCRFCWVILLDILPRTIHGIGCFRFPIFRSLQQAPISPRSCAHIAF